MHNASWVTKLWPEEYWQQLISDTTQAGYSILLPSGNAEEQQRAQRLAQAHANVIALPHLNLSEVAYLLTRAQAAEIIGRLKGLYFPERTRRVFLSIVSELTGRNRASRMRQFLDTEAPNAKQDDARLLIARIRENCGC